MVVGAKWGLQYADSGIPLSAGLHSRLRSGLGSGDMQVHEAGSQVWLAFSVSASQISGAVGPRWGFHVVRAPTPSTGTALDRRFPWLRWRWSSLSPCYASVFCLTIRSHAGSRSWFCARRVDFGCRWSHWAQALGDSVTHYHPAWDSLSSKGLRAPPAGSQWDSGKHDSSILFLGVCNGLIQVPFTFTWVSPRANRGRSGRFWEYRGVGVVDWRRDQLPCAQYYLSKLTPSLALW